MTRTNDVPASKPGALRLRCRHCGGGLERCEGELYCPDCTSYTTSALGEQADDEAHRERQTPAPADDGPPDDECPW